MSAELLNLYDKAVLPEHFTGLDRHLLEHYCSKHIDSLGKAIVPMTDLLRIFNARDKSILRSRARLRNAGALIQITKGFPDQASEFAVSKTFLVEHQQVTDGRPVTRNRLPRNHLQVTEESLTGSRVVTNESPGGYPIQEYKITKEQQPETYAVSLDLFLKEKLPNSKRFALTPTITKTLVELEHKGTSFNAVRATLESLGNFPLDNPKAYVTSRLVDLLACEPDWSWDNLPPKCSDTDCHPKTRTLPHRYEIESNPPGATRNECLKCNPYALSRKGA